MSKIKIILSIVLVVFILTIIIMFTANKFTSGIIVSDEKDKTPATTVAESDKIELLNKLSQEDKITPAELEQKKQLLESLSKQQVTSSMTDAEKLRLLEELNKK